MIYRQMPVRLASGDIERSTTGITRSDIKYKGIIYENVELYALKNVCTDIILGISFMNKFKEVKFLFDGDGSLECTAMDGEMIPRLFANLNQGCRPIAVKSRNYSQLNKVFIKEEVKRMLSEGIITHSQSPWRAQVLIVRSNASKPRMVIDYASTINKYTELDAYPLPKIDDLAREVAQYKYFIGHRSSTCIPSNTNQQAG
ncbi:hypothetical protein ACOME3_007598 [Neoechinorhynchus agilis]